MISLSDPFNDGIMDALALAEDIKIDRYMTIVDDISEVDWESWMSYHKQNENILVIDKDFNEN